MKRSYQIWRGWTRCAPLLAALALAGCKLVDQRTFAPAPEAKTPAPAPAAAPAAPSPAESEGRRALVTIDTGTAQGASYQGLLRVAVRAAELRDPNVQYDVVGLAPTSADAKSAEQDAATVMRSIIADGVPAARIHLGLRTAPGSTRQVRVYVR
ncbi:MAG: hypothetical protein JO227_05495 [Acetobacteraceae bacterium]|nr:hypothetical protein [Acetobacteraceae bacterium]